MGLSVSTNTHLSETAIQCHCSPSAFSRLYLVPSLTSGVRNTLSCYIIHEEYITASPAMSKQEYSIWVTVTY